LFSGEDDVLGVSIFLPPLTQEGMYTMLRRLWQVDMPYVQIKGQPLVPIPGSEIRYYKNGIELGVAFKDLNNGTASEIFFFKKKTTPAL
jgi:hypothetical protein